MGVEYTEVDAFFDILIWQIPVPCGVAACFLATLLTSHITTSASPLWWCPIIGGECGAAVLFLCAPSIFIAVWLAVAIPILMLDILLIPPVFAFIRYMEATRIKAI